MSDNSNKSNNWPQFLSKTIETSLNEEKDTNTDEWGATHTKNED